MPHYHIQVAEQQRNPKVKMQSEEGADVPDIVMVERYGGTRHVLFTIEVRWN